MSGRDSPPSEEDVQIFQIASTELELVSEEEQPASPNRPAAGAQGPSTTGKKRGQWLDDVRTTLWQGEEDHPRPGRETLPMGSVPRRSPGSPGGEPRHQAPPSGASAPVAHQAGLVPVGQPYVDEAYEDPYRDDYGYDQRGEQPLMIEAPSRIEIKPAGELRPDPSLEMMVSSGSVVAEQYRILAIKIKESRGLRVVALVAPTAAGEGEMVACNVALALAEGERSRVLLIDANLRQPRVGSLFGVPELGGFSEQVRHHCRVESDPWQVLHVSGTLHLMLAGQVEKNPSALLSSEAVSDLMNEVRRVFDYVVVSPSPVMESADMKILQDHLDGAILVARAGTTRGDSVKHSIRQIGEGKFVGTVLTGTKRAHPPL